MLTSRSRSSRPSVSFPISYFLFPIRQVSLGPASRSVVPLLGARGGVRLVRADDDAPPGAVALRIARRVADHVLARELVGDLSVDAGQLVGRVREEHAATGLLRELAQHVVRLIERPAQVIGP